MDYFIIDLSLQGKVYNELPSKEKLHFMINHTQRKVCISFPLIKFRKKNYISMYAYVVYIHNYMFVMLVMIYLCYIKVFY